MSEQVKKAFRAKVIASDGPAFGAYLAGSAADGEAIIMLNLKLCLNVDRDPRGCAAETLAHEVLHACQDILGEEITEKDVIENLHQIEEVDYEICEDTEQVIQLLTSRIQEFGERQQDLLSRLEKLITGALRATMKAHGGTVTADLLGSATKSIWGALRAEIEALTEADKQVSED